MYIGNIKSIRVDFKNCVNTTLLVYLLFDLFVSCYTFIFFSQDETVPFSHLKSNWKVTEMWQNCRAMPFSHFSISFSYHSINWITEVFFLQNIHYFLITLSLKSAQFLHNVLRVVWKYRVALLMVSHAVWK